MTVVGAVRKNRGEVPALLVNTKRKPVYHTDAVYDPEARAFMVSHKYVKHQFITLFSNYHSNTHILENAAHNKQPDIVKFYNETKGGVDELSNLISVARCKKRVNRWPVAIFCNMLDVSALNAFIIFNNIIPEWGAGKSDIRRRFLFVCNLGDALCAPYVKARQGMPHDDFDIEAPSSDKIAGCVKCAKLARLSDLYTLCMACRQRMALR